MSEQDFEKLELYISCKKLHHTSILGTTDPQVRVFLKSDESDWTLHGQTEVFKNTHNPTFAKTIFIEYIFSEHQPIKFQVVVESGGKKIEEIGNVEVTVAKIIGADHHTLIEDILDSHGKASGGKMKIRAEVRGDVAEILFFQFAAVQLKNVESWFSNISPFLRIYKQEDGDWERVYDTERLKD